MLPASSFQGQNTQYAVVIHRPFIFLYTILRQNKFSATQHFSASVSSDARDMMHACQRRRRQQTGIRYRSAEATSVGSSLLLRKSSAGKAIASSLCSLSLC
ncbi:hypothetical protein D918_09614 [Trichuris suis]|nr:hypothetical protein D918_09614 [Trichuris suis]